MTLAIDFGTSNTVVARWNPVTQQGETVVLPGLCPVGSALVPSLLYVEDAGSEGSGADGQAARLVVGQAVRDRGLDLATDSRFFRSFKRGIGATVQGFLPELDGRSVTFEQVGEWFLERLLGAAAQELGPIEDLIVTVPVDSFEVYRSWLGAALARGGQGVRQVRMIDEPTAAALGYGLTGAGRVLVVDFGGGTLDLALVQLDLDQAVGKAPLGFLLKWGEKRFDPPGSAGSGQKPKLAKVLAKAGLNLGGADLDGWIVDYLCETQGLPRSPWLLRLAERLKIQLSSQPIAQESYFDEETFTTVDLRLDRTVFEQLLTDRGFFDQLDGALGQVQQQAQQLGIGFDQLAAVLLVGGTSQVPAVRRWLEAQVDPALIRGDRPFEAIAQGALLLGQGVEVKDFLYHSYGLRYWNSRRQAHDWHRLIVSGQSYPMAEPVELTLGASVENQPSIELLLGELGSSGGGMEVFFDGDRLITKTTESRVKVLNETAKAIAQLMPLGSPGVDRVRILFRVDESRFLRITVEDLLTLETLVEDQVVVRLS
jgi:molecular chaperone DnaK (HSP70)